MRLIFSIGQRAIRRSILFSGYEADHGETDYVKGHRWGVTAMANLTDKLVLAGGYSDYAFENAQNAAAVDASEKIWMASLTWNVATGLYIRGAVHKFIDDNALSSDGTFSLRIHRSF